MIREHIGSVIPPEEGFRWRGGEITRLESFSDAVFAFAVTLLIVSLEVPRTYSDLMQVIRGFPAFGICFGLLANLWREHYVYFRRYGLQTGWAVFLNCVLLFFILFYVYPLKFLFRLLFGEGTMEPWQAKNLLMIYGGGYAAIFLVMALLYWHALGKAGELGLNPLESFRTWRSLIDCVAMVLVGLISCLLALVLPQNLVGLAGYFYFSIAIYYTIAGAVFGKRDKKLRGAA
jgi:uncharacterized membrane protein